MNRVRVFFFLLTLVILLLIATAFSFAGMFEATRPNPPALIQ